MRLRFSLEFDLISVFSMRMKDMLGIKYLKKIMSDINGFKVEIN